MDQINPPFGQSGGPRCDWCDELMIGQWFQTMLPNGEIMSYCSKECGDKLRGYTDDSKMDL